MYHDMSGLHALSIYRLSPVTPLRSQTDNVETTLWAVISVVITLTYCGRLKTHVFFLPAIICQLFSKAQQAKQNAEEAGKLAKKHLQTYAHCIIFWVHFRDGCTLYL